MYYYLIGGISIGINKKLDELIEQVNNNFQSDDCFHIEIHENMKVPEVVKKKLGKLISPPINSQTRGVKGLREDELFLSMTHSIARIYKKKVDLWPRIPEKNDFSIDITDELLAILAVKNGKLPLHGAAFEMNGYANILLAPSGTGKSTFAAAYAKLYHTIISDDLCILEEKDNEIYLQGTLPYIKLGKQAEEIIKGINGYEVKKGSLKKKYLINEIGIWKTGIFPLNNIYILYIPNKKNGYLGVQHNGWRKWRQVVDFIVGGRAIQANDWSKTMMLVKKIIEKKVIYNIAYEHRKGSLEDLIKIVRGE